MAIKCPQCDNILSSETRFCTTCQIEVPYGKAKVVPKQRIGVVKPANEAYTEPETVYNEQVPAYTEPEEVYAEPEINSDTEINSEIASQQEISVTEAVEEAVEVPASEIVEEITDVAAEAPVEEVTVVAEEVSEEAAEELVEISEVPEAVTFEEIAEAPVAEVIEAPVAEASPVVDVPAEEYIICSVCGAKNLSGFAMCELCGSPLGETEENDVPEVINVIEDIEVAPVAETPAEEDYIVCKACGIKNPKDFSMCELCGSPLNSEEIVIESDFNTEPVSFENEIVIETEEPIEEAKISPAVPPLVEDGKLQCPKCGADIPSDCNFCITCGAMLESVMIDVKAVEEELNSAVEISTENLCAACGAEIPPEYNFCTVCGATKR